MAKAVDELRTMILDRYPTATFRISRGEEPGEIFMWTDVDVDDPDLVKELTLDRELELLINEGLSVHVIPIHRTPEAGAVA
jgi:hypothetical protein